MSASDVAVDWPVKDTHKEPHLGAFDSPLAIAAAVIVSFVGNGVFIGLPVIVGAMADSLGFNEEELGYIASAETGGLLVAALLTSALITRVNRRYLAVFGIVLAACANDAVSVPSPHPRCTITPPCVPASCRIFSADWAWASAPARSA